MVCLEIGHTIPLNFDVNFNNIHSFNIIQNLSNNNKTLTVIEKPITGIVFNTKSNNTIDDATKDLIEIDNNHTCYILGTDVNKLYIESYINSVIQIYHNDSSVILTQDDISISYTNFDDDMINNLDITTEMTNFNFICDYFINIQIHHTIRLLN